MSRATLNKVVRILFKALFLLGFCASAGAAWGQDGSPSPLPAVAEGQTALVNVSTPEPNAGQLSDNSQVRQLGAANFITSNFGLAHWGPFTLGTTTISQGYENGTDGSNSLTSLGTNVMAGHTFRHSHIVLQYSPKLRVLDGQLVKNYSDQNSGVDTYFSLGPHMSLSLGGRFQTFNTSNLIDSQPFFSTDTFRANYTQQAFLRGPSASRFMWTSVQAGFSYLLSPRTHINVIPGYTYSRVTGLAAPQLSHTYGATVELEHALTATKSVGAYYRYEAIRINNRTGVGVTPYHDAGLNYAQQIRPTWGVKASVGAYKSGFPGGGAWSGIGSLSIAKTFGKSTLSLGLFRGQGLAGVITNQTVNRADLLYHYVLSRKIQIDSGVGYAIFRTGAPVKGLYGTSRLDWQLLPTLSALVTYGYTNQHGDGTQFLTLSSHFAIVGFRWHPRVAAR